MANIAPNHARAGHDVIVVGSGASGGMAAYVLTKAGLKVLMLEAGRDYDPLTETPMFSVPTDAPLRGTATPDKEFGYWDANVGGGWSVPGEPYTVAKGSKFQWWRARMLGGRTNHWTRLTFRLGPFDFKGHSRDGLGVDWPLTYDEVAPYYDKVERLIGVFGDAEGIENSPDSPPGILLPPPKLRSHEAWMQRAMGRTHDIPVVPAHVAILTKARPEQDRQACFYATDCGRGCQIKANFQTTTVLLPPARKTGGLEVRTGAMVYQVVVDAQGRAKGVRYIDKASGRHEEVHARAVVLGASACESARILLQSDPKGRRQGLANNSGQVGRNLTDTVATKVHAAVPQLAGLPNFNDEGVSMPHAYVPWWLTRQQKAGKLGFARGYHIEISGGRGMPDPGTMMDVARLSNSVGAHLHADIRHHYGSIITLSGRGEMLPNAQSFCELDPVTKDKFGLPVLRFHFAWGEQEKAQAEHQRRTFASVFEAMGAKLITDMNQPIDDAISIGGEIIHELGTARMGADASASVVNHECEAWDVPGLFVVDGATFASNPDKNPTLTIMALTWRAMDRLVARLRRAS